MIFNSKQLEELENIHDSTGAFEEEGDDEAGFDEVGEAAMDWRRGLIEEAAENIKRAKTRPVEPHIQYAIHSMLFDREEKRFARVQRSVPGYLKIVYLSGGDREFGSLDVIGYLKDQGAEKRLSELAEQLGLPEIEVAAELDRLGIIPVEEPEGTEAPVAAEAPTPEPARAPGRPGGAPGRPAPVPTPPRPKQAAEEEGEAEDEASDDAEEVSDDDIVAVDDLDDAGDDADDVALVAKPGGKAAAKVAKASPKPAAKPARAAAPAPSKHKSQVPTPAKGKTQPPKAAKGNGATGKGSVNPIDDPNGFIKANFQEMSNRELARLTGLSEHTIRRKLGEWSLKRKKEI